MPHTKHQTPRRDVETTDVRVSKRDLDPGSSGTKRRMLPTPTDETAQSSSIFILQVLKKIIPPSLSIFNIHSIISSAIKYWTAKISSFPKFLSKQRKVPAMRGVSIMKFKYST